MITLSADQAAAVRAVCCWFRHGIDTQQVFFLSGYAGTGKSTTLAYAIAELGLAPDQIVYGCFTMKAALVLRRNGLPASTIHRAIYVPSDPSAAGYETALQQFEALQQGRPSGMPVTLWRRRLCDLERQLADIRSVKFVLNDKSPVRDCRLVVLDEVSMVNEEMADDVLAFGKPVLVLGDPAQLPPIKGASPFAARTPDVMLTEIHRQAAESPIIYLATLARRGERIPFGSFGSTAHKLRADARGPEDLLAASQVICGKHVTRRRLNNEIKAAAGYPAALPEGRGEKLIGLKNMHEIGTFFADTYHAKRPRGDHPVYEVDSIDRSELTAEYDGSGRILVPAKSLDDIAIVSLPRPHGYQVGALVEARVRFAEMCDIDTEWGLDPDE
jgi:exodeoxyribonuclease-5